MLAADEGTYKADNEAANGSIPRRERLEGRSEWQGLAIDSLSLHAGIETDICESNAEPRHETRDGRHLGEPVEDLAGASVDAHVRQEREQRGEDKRRYGQTITKRLLEHRGRVSGNREAVYMSDVR